MVYFCNLPGGLGGLTSGANAASTTTWTATETVIPYISFISGATGATSSVYYESAWQSWVSTAATTAVVTDEWFGEDTAASNSYATINSAWTVWVRKIHETAEQRAERQRLEEQQRIAAQEAQRKRDLAHKVAEELLLKCLTPTQRELYQRSKKIVVKGGKSGHEYEIDVTRIAGNVTRRDGRRFCAYVPQVPIADVILAQKLAIELNEDHFLERANAS